MKGQTGNISLIFNDNDNGIKEALEFGGSIEKSFKIENTGTIDAVAKINWSNFVNTYLEGSLTYKLSCSEDENYNMVGNYASTGLMESSRLKIDKVKWHMGATTKSTGLSGDYLYVSERSNNSYQNSRDTFVFQEVGLIHASDYAYTYFYNVDNKCFTSVAVCNGSNPSASWLYLENYNLMFQKTT